jgi:rubrerythrin
MDVSIKTKKQLIEIINTLSNELRAKNQAAAAEQAKNAFNLHNFATIQYTLNQKNALISESNDLAKSLLALLDISRCEGTILLRIQQQLIDMLGGKVWICPSCGKVAPGKEGPHVILCSDCIKTIDK